MLTNSSVYIEKLVNETIADCIFSAIMFTATKNASFLGDEYLVVV